MISILVLLLLRFFFTIIPLFPLPLSLELHPTHLYFKNLVYFWQVHPILLTKKVDKDSWVNGPTGQIAAVKRRETICVEIKKFLQAGQ